MAVATRAAGHIERYASVAGAADAIVNELHKCLSVDGVMDTCQPGALVRVYLSTGAMFPSDGGKAVADALALAIKTHLPAIRETFQGTLLAAVGEARTKAEAQAFELMRPVQVKSAECAA